MNEYGCTVHNCSKRHERKMQGKPRENMQCKKHNTPRAIGNLFYKIGE